MSKENVLKLCQLAATDSTLAAQWLASTKLALPEAAAAMAALSQQLDCPFTAEQFIAVVNEYATGVTPAGA
ncbi:hypothetical protein CEG14_19915 [Bordetella genomosp. 1]|uniref:Uncharacterized protein n=1 Tax=Bordetella genomosp. 1 TaxID=1395607 RepID=A0A261S7H9_9BORD|nr:hypothetical protein [Bordetella genomosp. 1]OZI33115.1 hypothetical protein CEG14_19915 [Bordetella genomosp. 1]